MVGRPDWCFLLRISDKQRVVARETLRDATMTYHSATQNWRAIGRFSGWELSFLVLFRLFGII